MISMNREEKEEGKIVAAFSPGIFQEASFRSSEMQLLLTLINTRIRARIHLVQCLVTFSCS